MPIREGKAKLWFRTKEEQSEFDDLMLSNMELTSEKEDDDNYSLLYLRKKRENFLTLNIKAQQEVAQFGSLVNDSTNFINKYLAGKRDHSIDRYWHIQKGVLGWAVGYLLFRELPVRNFYARCWLMIFGYCMLFERKSSVNPLKHLHLLDRDEFTDKDIRNYQAYSDMAHPIIPHSSNKIPESKVWQLNQPAYMREAPEAKIGELAWMVAAPEPKVVAWDGTFNMPLAGLAHPLHKDAKFIDFCWWEY